MKSKYRNIIIIVLVLCILLLGGDIYLKKYKEAKNEKAYISSVVYFSLLDLNKPLEEYNAMADSTDEERAAKFKFFADNVTDKIIPLIWTGTLVDVDSNYLNLRQLSDYLLKVKNREDTDKENFNEFLNKLGQFNDSLKDYKDYENTIVDLGNKDTELNKKFTDVIEVINK